MTEEDRLALANQMRLRLLSLRKERKALHRKLTELEAREEQLARAFRKNFPSMEFEPPAATWDDLTNADRATISYIARRGHIRRVAEGVRLRQGRS